jgi:hypothetical protein
MDTYDPYVNFLMARGVTGVDLQAALVARAAQEAGTLMTPLQPVTYIAAAPPATMGITSILAGFPTWAWIALAGVGLFIFLRRGKEIE